MARFDEEGRYYRAEIIRIVGDFADLKFVDYGNQQKWVGNEERDWVPAANVGKEFNQATTEFNTRYVKSLLIHLVKHCFQLLLTSP